MSQVSENKMEEVRSTDEVRRLFTEKRIELWNSLAEESEQRYSHGKLYKQHLKRVYRHLISPGERVLEIGCGKGDLLAAVEPAYGVGVDFAPEMIAEAAERYKDRPELSFSVQDAHTFEAGETFDAVILSDLVNDLWDVQTVFERIKKVCTPRTRIFLNFYSLLWEKPLRAAEKFGLARPKLQQNWLTVHDVSNLLYLSGFETIRQWEEYLFPFAVPGVRPFFNRYLAKVWPFYIFCLAHVMVARPVKPVEIEEQIDDSAQQPEVTVVVAARNEEGNIDSIFERVPQMGKGTELLFVEGGSKDNTYETIEKTIPKYPELRARLFKQPGKGKGDAVRTGFAQAKGRILMILDADLTVPPEDLPRFYEALKSNKGEFINGVRLVYPMESRAMRFFNLLGNKFFSLVFSWLLGTSIKDTLCGTKVLTKKDYERIADNRAYFGEFDPFGDFDLIFGAAKQNMKLVDMPVRYRERKYGDTNISRWKHGLMLLRMVLFAMRKIKFF